MMKKYYTLLFAAAVICIAGTAVCLILMPGTVPLHYNISGAVDKTGSKYFFLLFPVIVAVNGFVTAAAAKNERKKEENSNEKMLLITGVLTGFLLTALGLFFMVKGIGYNPGSAAPSAGDINKFVGIAVGIILVITGNAMPKARRNSTVGVRTKWSLADDTVWQKTQRFGGRVMLISGLLIIVLSLFVPGIWNTAMFLAVITAAAVICTAASRKYYIEEKEKTE